MIKEIKCPLCAKSLGGDENEMNAIVLAHCKEQHPSAAEQITKTIMEIGHLRDKIKRLKKDIRRVTGYHIPDTQLSQEMLNEQEQTEAGYDKLASGWIGTNAKGS